MADVRPLYASSAQRDRITGIVRGAVEGAHFEIEHGLHMATSNQLPEWLRQELSVALLDLEGILQRLGG